MINHNLTPKQLDILTLLIRFRFLNTKHFQNIFNHKDPHRIKAWLKDLNQKHYIHRFYNRQTFAENTRPAVFCLATKSRKILKQLNKYDTQILDRIYSEKDRSKQFQDHSLCIADIYIHLKNYTKLPKTLHFFTKIDISNYASLPDPRPDAYIVVKNSRKATKRYFLEVFDEGTPRFVLKRRIKTYIDYVQDDMWHEASKDPIPSILLVCTNEKMRNYLSYHIKRTLADKPEIAIKFFITTRQMLEEHGLQTTVWQQVKTKAD